MIWAACIMVGIRPPKVKATWEECDVMTQAKAIGYYQTAEHERAEWARAGAMRM